MNYDNDFYISNKKQQNVIEGNPQPSRELPRPFRESKHSQDMYKERKAMKSIVNERGQAGSKHHPRG